MIMDENNCDSEESSYVARLHQVFLGCDSHGSGFLARPQLLQLCQELQLHQQANLIIDHLLGDDPDGKVDFDEFKEKFVSLLAQSVGIADLNIVDDDAPEFSPEREVSPKYVWGSKKYGRRSRPEGGEAEEGEEEEELEMRARNREDSALDLNEDPCNGSDDEGGGGSDFSDTEVFISRPAFISPRDEEEKALLTGDVKSATGVWGRPGSVESPRPLVKRRRRMTSSDKSPLSTHSPAHHLSLDEPSGPSSLCAGLEEEYFRSVWGQLGIATDGYLDRDQLTRVCQHIGMENMSDEVISQLFEKLGVDQNGRINVDSFLGLLRNGDSSFNSSSSHLPLSLQHPSVISPALATSNDSNNNSSPNNNNNNNTSSSSTANEIPTLPTPGNLNRKPTDIKSSENEHRSPHTSSSGSGTEYFNESGIFSSIDTDNTGYADPEKIVEMWEQLGMSGGFRILRELGFSTTCQVRLLDLTSSLEDILHNPSDSEHYFVAFSSYHHELEHLRTCSQHLHEEREKLRLDLAEANARASLLAQEVDDHQARLEKTCNERILILEKRYQEQIRHLQEVLQTERETLNQQLCRLRQKYEKDMDVMREEETKLRDKVCRMQTETAQLEREVRETSEKLQEADRLSQQQQRELEVALADKKKLEEQESGRELAFHQQCTSLASDLHACRSENKILRDHNDELTAEVESLKKQLATRLSIDSNLLRVPEPTGLCPTPHNEPDFDAADISDSTDDADKFEPSRYHRRNGSCLAEYITGMGKYLIDEPVDDEASLRHGKVRRRSSHALGCDTQTPPTICTEGSD